jgi:hypothetical protein
MHNSKENHFNLITSKQNFFRSNYFCHQCLTPYNRNGQHVCDSTCKSCHKQKCEKLFEERCRCCVIMNNSNCIQRHTEMVCYLKRLCLVCNRTIQHYSGKHVRENQKWCYNCKNGVNIDHKCYMLTEAQ